MIIVDPKTMEPIRFDPLGINIRDNTFDLGKIIRAIVNEELDKRKEKDQ